jgi:hypothetical protein
VPQRHDPEGGAQKKLCTRRGRDSLTPLCGKEFSMSGSKLVAVNTANAVGDVREWEEGDPKQFVLRGNAECDALLDTLDQLGVARFNCLCRTRYCESGDVFATTPKFKRGVRITRRRLQAAEHRARLLCDCVQEAVFQAVEKTWVEGYDFLIEAIVVISDPDHPRGIIAWVTAFVTCESDFEDREMWLL